MQTPPNRLPARRFFYSLQRSLVVFKAPLPLNPQQHMQLRLADQPDYRFAAHEVVTPFFSGEMWQIAREFVTVFPLAGDGLPLAILGSQQGVNAYVGTAPGQPLWWARYVPAHLRRYPFILAPRAAQEGDAATDQHFTLCIDSAAPQLQTTQGRPLFTPDGQPDALLQQVQQALLGLQRDFAITQKLVQQIDAAGLLVEQALQIQRAGQEPTGMTGFRVVDQAKLRSTTPALLAELAQTGALDLIYAHMGSLTNLHDGLLAKKANTDTKSAPLSSSEMDALLASDDGTFSFNFSH